MGLAGKERLTGAEAALLEALPRGRKIDLPALAGAFENQISRQYLSILLARLVRKKRAMRLKRGVFFVPSASGPSEYQLGLGLAKGRGAYIGFASALYLYHWIDEQPFTVFVVNSRVSRSVKKGLFEYRLVNLGEKAQGITTVNGVDVSSPAKTVFDAFLHPEYCGGMQKVLSAFSQARLSNNDWRELLYYLEELGSACLRQRIGFAAEKLFGSKTPRFFVSRLKKAAAESKSTCFLDPSASRKGKYSAEWKLVQNTGLPAPAEKVIV